MSSSSSSPSSGSSEQKSADVKAASSTARENRLTLRKNNEEVLRKALQNEARKLCEGTVKEFGECAVANGMMVVLNCRKQNKAMSECMDKHYNEEKFNEFLASRGLAQAPPRPGVLESIKKMVGN